MAADANSIDDGGDMGRHSMYTVRIDVSARKQEEVLREM